MLLNAVCKQQYSYIYKGKGANFHRQRCILSEAGEIFDCVDLSQRNYSYIRWHLSSIHIHVHVLASLSNTVTVLYYIIIKKVYMYLYWMSTPYNYYFYTLSIFGKIDIKGMHLIQNITIKVLFCYNDFTVWKSVKYDNFSRLLIFY